MRKFFPAVLAFAFLFSATRVVAAETADSQKIFPKKVEADTNYDGKIDRLEYYQDNKIEHTEADTDFDGQMDDWTYYGADGKPAKSERDTNKDGKADTWFTY